MEVVVAVRRGYKPAKQAKSNRESLSKLLQCSICSVEKPVVDFSRRQKLKSTPCCKLCVEAQRNATSSGNDIAGDGGDSKLRHSHTDEAAASEGHTEAPGSLLATRRTKGGRADAREAVLEQSLRRSASGGGELSAVS